MTTQADILTCIADGRLAVERTVAFSMACTLAKVEAMVREMRPAIEPVTIERGNTADLADLEEMRDLLDGADWPPTPLGLSEVLRRADEADELDRRHAEALATISDLRARIDALTPGPWRTVAEEVPPRGEMVAVINNGDGAVFAYVTEIPSVGKADWVKLWRRLPAGLLDVPAPAVTP